MKKVYYCYSKYQLWLLLCICLPILFSCSSEFEDSLQELSNDEFIEFTFTKTNSRAEVDNSGSGSFNNGDIIGLYLDNGENVEFRKLTYSDGKWTPALRRSDFGNGELSISAHYPLISEDNTKASFNIPTEQNVSGYNPADVLFAKNILATGEYKADMKFKHVMHRLIISPKEGLKEADIKVRTIQNGNINLITGEASVSADSKSFVYINPKKNSDGSLEAIIYPQPTDEYKTEEGLISINLNDKKTVYKAPEKGNDGTDFIKFEPGKTFTINLSAANPDFDWTNKTVWVYGINPPKESDWKMCFPEQYSTWYLPLKPEYGWYDVNKRNPSNTDYGTPDGMLCWAASASNMLHWWVSINKEYIDKYIKLDKYKGPSLEFNFEKAITEKEQESEIFQTFIDSFKNQAGYTNDGINWFIHGDTPLSPALTSPYNHAGYFKDVFPSDVKLSVNIGGMGKETFNKTIKDALLNKKAIGFNSGKVTSSHAMVIWGAEFDENGDVSYMYFADNNDRDNLIKEGYGCIRNKIVYKQMDYGGYMTEYSTGYLDNGVPSEQTIPISRLYTLELGTKYWDEYFKKIENNK